MSNNNFSTHLTATHRVSKRGISGWEFVCPECGYHARYWERTQPGLQNLEILNTGDPDARHTSSSPLVSSCEWEIDPLMEGIEDFPEDPVVAAEEESWLTPELRMQLENIVKAFDEDLPEGPPINW
jgi:hypothetical protein